ncbi:hypothetical protein BJX76DRAFT_362306 [Aspergillus varians]
MRILFFSNQFPAEGLFDLFRRLRLQSRSPQHVILRRLLEETTGVIRDEIRLLPAEMRSRIPPFQSILDLAEDCNWNWGQLAPVFEYIFRCLISLCLFVGDYETRPHEFRFTSSDCMTTGLGLGFLASTIIVASPSLLDVPATAAEIIRIAMRTGLVVYERSQDVEREDLDMPPGRWTTHVLGLGEEAIQQELDIFHKSTETPRPSQVYISVVEPDGNVFVNGPPSKLRQLFDIPGNLQFTPRVPISPRGPCHAAHLYDHNHLLWILKHVRPEIANRDCSGAARLLSMADGQPLPSRTALELFESATHVLLARTTRLANLVTTITHGTWWLTELNVEVETCSPSVVVESMVNTMQTDHPGCTTSLRNFTQWLFSENSTLSGNDTESIDTKVAVVGMSCRLPGGADDIDRFWELLEQGRDAHGQPPVDRFHLGNHKHTTSQRANSSQTPFGCFINKTGLFDAGFFDMSPREAAQTDPAHRLALLTAYEALEQSGYVPDRTPSTRRDTIGTIYGQCFDDYREANARQDLDMYFIPGNSRGFAPGRISYFFKFSGPSLSCDTMCSASLSAVQIACATLQRGDADMVVAGGLNILTSSDSFAGLSRASFLSQTGGSKVFDNDADGYCRADGVGSLVLKRLSDAQRDNDNILGVIIGATTNHSSAAVSITHPHSRTQEELYRKLLRQAGVSPLDVDMIEMDGTGTRAGDVTEMDSVTRVFSPPGSQRAHKLHIGSVKANLGHGEAAAGITSLMKALLILQRDSIPKHVGIKTCLNSKFPDLDQLNIHIPQETIHWPSRPDRKRFVMINNFSAAGGNTSLILEEPPARTEPQGSPQTSFTVAVSAKSAVSLKSNIKRLIAYLQRNPYIPLGSLAYTTTARRMHHPHCIAVHGASVPDILDNLQLRLTDVVESQKRKTRATPPRVAFVFGGQGSFYLGIGRDLIEGYPSYRKEIHRLDQICLLHGFPSILPALTDRRITDTQEITPLVAQLTAVCVQIAMYTLWISLGVKPDVVIGASLGEFASLHAAGVLSASDTIYLAGQRGMLMEQMCTINSRAMLTVKASLDDIRQCVLDRPYEVACVNGTRNIAIGGLIPDIAAIKESLESRGHRTFPLNLPYVFHSSHLDPILDRFGEITSKVPLRSPRIPIISPLLADVVPVGATLPSSYLLDATRQVVRFCEALEKSWDDGVIDGNTVWVEVSVHQSYSSPVCAAVPDMEVIVPSLRSDQNNWHTLASSMAALHEAGVKVDWNEWYRPFESEMRLLDLPSYQWNMKEHWIQHDGDRLLVNENASSVDKYRVPSLPLSLRTPLLHDIVTETFWEEGGTVVMQSDVHADDFFAMASGPRMSGRPVVSAFLYRDMALTLAKYMYTKIRPNTAPPAMHFGNVRIFHSLIPQNDRSYSQLVRMGVDAVELNRPSGIMQVSLFQVLDDGSLVKDLATGMVSWGGTCEEWNEEWANFAHLVTSRIEVLHALAHEGRANRLMRDMVYQLFQNVVDYSEPYRGIQSVVIHGLEAVADVTLASGNDAMYTTPLPHIDSIFHVGGLVLNVSPAIDHSNTVYVMEGWKSMRFGEPLVPGKLYRSYVKMTPVKDSSGFFTGDVYVLDGSEIIGQLARMSFRPLPRILMSRFFNTHDRTNVPIKLQTTASTPDSSGSPTNDSAVGPPTPGENELDPLEQGSEQVLDSEYKSRKHELASKALDLIASETGIHCQDLTDETHLSEIGVDSLLSLALVERFAMDLNMQLPRNFLLESPTVRDIKARILSCY